MIITLCRLICILLCATFCLASYADGPQDSLRNSVVKSCLGKIVDKDKCLVTGQDFTIIKSLGTRYHYLFVPVTVIAGIESPEFWTTGYPAWFQKAWRFRHIAAPWLGNGVAAEKLGIAINSLPRRTQDQLHIHINCIRKDVQDEINSAAFSKTWAPITLQSSGGQTFKGIALPGSNIPDDLLIKFYQSSSVEKKPANITLFAALTDKGKAIVLEGQYDPENPTTGSAEDLLTTCS